MEVTTYEVWLVSTYLALIKLLKDLKIFCNHFNLTEFLDQILPVWHFSVVPPPPATGRVHSWWRLTCGDDVGEVLKWQKNVYKLIFSVKMLKILGCDIVCLLSTIPRNRFAFQDDNVFPHIALFFGITFDELINFPLKNSSFPRFF